MVYKDQAKGTLNDTYENRILEAACKLSNFWLRQRLDPRVTGHMEPGMHDWLDKLEKLTRGDERRCFCLSKNSGHDLMCPARRNK